jgi:hypothetical protein
MNPLINFSFIRKRYNELLTFFLRKEAPTEQEVLRRISNQHKKRQRDSDNALMRNFHI